MLWLFFRSSVFLFVSSSPFFQVAGAPSSSSAIRIAPLRDEIGSLQHQVMQMREKYQKMSARNDRCVTQPVQSQIQFQVRDDEDDKKEVVLSEDECIDGSP